MSIIRSSLIGFCLLALTLKIYAQTEEHTVVLGKDITYTENGHFKQGAYKNPEGLELDLNN